MNTIIELTKQGHKVTYTGPADDIMVNEDALKYITVIRQNGQIVGYIDGRPPHVPLFIRVVKKQ